MLCPLPQVKAQACDAKRQGAPGVVMSCMEKCKERTLEFEPGAGKMVAIQLTKLDMGSCWHPGMITENQAHRLAEARNFMLTNHI